jgi:hypothetical protein
VSLTFSTNPDFYQQVSGMPSSSFASLPLASICFC